MHRTSFHGPLLAVALLLAPVAGADTISLSPDAPDRYVVQRGDTLWDIAGRFLREPWQWPLIWEENPQIENPHLIYPGDELLLTQLEGKPKITLRRAGRPTVKLSPRVRSEPLQIAIPTIPVDTIHQFLSRPLVVSEGELAAAPYIMSLGKEHLVGGPGSRVYARGLGPEPARRFTVYRQGPAYVDVDGEVLGYEAIHVADAVLERKGDPATLVLLRSKREVLEGDRLLPVLEEEASYAYMPSAPSWPVEGRIISVLDGVTQVGTHQIVVVNLGTADGIAPGHVMAVWQAGETVVDEFAARSPRAGLVVPEQEHEGPVETVISSAGRVGAQVVRAGRHMFLDLKDWAETGGTGRGELVTLPDEQAGIVMVFRPFERVSYALVMKSTRNIHILDTVTNP